MTLQRDPTRPGTSAGDRGGPDAGAADPTWLQLRRGADTLARDEGAGGLLERLVAHLTADRAAGPQATATALRVVDIGAGTGANRRYLAPRLPMAQEWVAVDHDPELLAHPGHGPGQTVVADVQDLPRVLRVGTASGEAADDGVSPGLLTCAALLDVLTRDQLHALATAVVRCGVPALLSLSVTGEVSWDPVEPADAVVDETFAAHQRRGGRPGPDAPALLRQLLEDDGVQVLAAATPWRLGTDRPLLRRWLDERVEAVLELQPGLAPVVDPWHRRRQEQLTSGLLRVQVEHVDLLALP